MTYELKFSEHLIHRHAVGLSATCVDFDVSKRMLVGTSYVLFDADKGSKFKFQSGFEISMSVESFGQPVRAYGISLSHFILPLSRTHVQITALVLLHQSHLFQSFLLGPVGKSSSKN